MGSKYAFGDRCFGCQRLETTTITAATAIDRKIQYREAMVELISSAISHSTISHSTEMEHAEADRRQAAAELAGGQEPEHEAQ